MEFLHLDGISFLIGVVLASIIYILSIYFILKKHKGLYNELNKELENLVNEQKFKIMQLKNQSQEKLVQEIKETVSHFKKSKAGQEVQKIIDKYEAIKEIADKS